jgi:alkylhydroperoxidase family enzyme
MARLPLGPTDPPFGEGKKLYQLAKARLGSISPDPYSRVVTLSPSFTKAVYYSLSNLRDHSLLSEKLFEAIGLLTARELDCPYLVNLQALALGRCLGQERIPPETEPLEQSKVFTDEERTVLALARKVVRSPNSITDEDFNALHELGYSDPQIMEVLATAGAFVMNATVMLALSVELS